MRLLHTMIRVVDLDQSIDFYTRVLGMRLLRRKDYPGGKFTLAFVGYGEESDTAVIELTHNWETSRYDHGNAFGHLAIGVGEGEGGDDIYQVCDRIRSAGCSISREPGPMKHGDTMIAFVQDPDGYPIELIQR